MIEICKNKNITIVGNRRKVNGQTFLQSRLLPLMFTVVCTKPVAYTIVDFASAKLFVAPTSTHVLTALDVHVCTSNTKPLWTKKLWMVLENVAR